MGQGTNGGGGTSESGGGGGMGMGLLGSLFGGSGGGGNAQVAHQAYAVDNPSLMAQLRQGLSDPQTMQALGSTMQQLGKTVGAANDIPAPAAQMLHQVMNQSQPTQRISGLGDMPTFSPTEANAILQSMGIHPGAMPQPGFTPSPMTRPGMAAPTLPAMQRMGY